MNSKNTRWANVLFMNLRQKEMEKMAFEDVQKFQADGLYDGPVIFFVKRVTPILRKNAEAIHAYGITNVRTKVIELLQSLVEIQQTEMKKAV